MGTRRGTIVVSSPMALRCCWALRVSRPMARAVVVLVVVRFSSILEISDASLLVGMVASSEQELP